MEFRTRLLHLLPTISFAALVLVGCGRPSAGPVSPTAHGGHATSPPAWLPPYSADQERLLAPSSAPVSVPAPRTFPNLERFGYASDWALTDPREALRVTQMVAEVVEKSPRQYALLDARSDQANWIAQYGPPGEDAADPWKIAAIDSHGEARLVESPCKDSARESYEAGAAKEKSGDTAGAILRYREALAESPDVPALHVALAHALESKSPREAEIAYRRAIEVDPTLGISHEGLSSVLAKRGDVSGARRELAHALAYHPKSRVGLALAAVLTNGSVRKARVEPFAVFIDVDSMGVIHVAAPPTPGARMYAGCRAVFRYEPELRASLFEMPRDEPYYLSAVEEMLCIESAIGALLIERGSASQDGRKPQEDPQTQALLGLAHTDGLLGYVMFEVLGKRRPERARTAPAGVHQAMVGYIDKYVLDHDSSTEDSRFVALVDSPPALH